MSNDIWNSDSDPEIMDCGLWAVGSGKVWACGVRVMYIGDLLR